MRSARVGGLVVALVGLSGFAGSGVAAGRPVPRMDVLRQASVATRSTPCFGAASRDPLYRCIDKTLASTVTPTPSQAISARSPRCADPEYTGGLSVCRFGRAPVDAIGNLALVGDSHAFHWKPAVQVVADALGWHGASITRTGCPFSRATAALAGPLRGQCTTWNRNVLAWFAVHPEVNEVFVSDHAGGHVLRPGKDPVATEAAGYIAAWAALPASVTRIVVIRDTPLDHFDTSPCIARALRRHELSATACAFSRRVATVLRPDPAVVAAEELGSSRVQVADLSRFFCDARRCYPVIGGALVYRDVGHMTDVFSTTLGPYLLRSLQPMTAPQPVYQL